HPGPGVLGVLGPIGGPVIGVEAVRRVRVDLELAGLACRLTGRLPLLNRLLRNALVLAAIEGEHRAFDLAGDVDRVLWDDVAELAIDAVHGTAAFRSGLCAAYIQVANPPQQKPVTASFAVSALPVDLA